MNKAVLNLDDFEVKNITFHSSTYPIDIDKVDVKKIVVSNNVLNGKKTL